MALQKGRGNARKERGLPASDIRRKRRAANGPRSIFFNAETPSASRIIDGATEPWNAMANKNRIYLVSCVAKKQTGTVAAKDLYISPWFRLARQYVERTGGPWFILSAKYGLLEPDRPISPYDETLNRMKAADRRAWAQRVESQMDRCLPKANEVAILAGVRYRQYLEAYLSDRFSSVRVPMRGLGIGKQLSWLKNEQAG